MSSCSSSCSRIICSTPTVRLNHTLYCAHTVAHMRPRRHRDCAQPFHISGVRAPVAHMLPTRAMASTGARSLKQATCAPTRSRRQTTCQRQHATSDPVRSRTQWHAVSWAGGHEQVRPWSTAPARVGYVPCGMDATTLCARSSAPAAAAAARARSRRSAARWPSPVEQRRQPSERYAKEANAAMPLGDAVECAQRHSFVARTRLALGLRIDLHNGTAHGFFAPQCTDRLRRPIRNVSRRA